MPPKKAKQLQEEMGRGTRMVSLAPATWKGQHDGLLLITTWWITRRLQYAALKNSGGKLVQEKVVTPLETDNKAQDEYDQFFSRECVPNKDKFKCIFWSL